MAATSAKRKERTAPEAAIPLGPNKNVIGGGGRRLVPSPRPANWFGYLDLVVVRDERTAARSSIGAACSVLRQVPSQRRQVDYMFISAPPCNGSVTAGAVSPRANSSKGTPAFLPRFAFDHRRYSIVFWPPLFA
jgi:hypothetical protein